MSDEPSVLWACLGLSSPDRAEPILRLLVELGVQVVGAQEGSLLVLDPEGKHLVFAMTVGPRESAQALIGQRVPVGQGLTGLAAQTHEVQIGSPVYKDVRQAGRRAQDTPDGQPTAVLAAPMLIDDELVGVISAVSFRQGKQFTPADAELYARIAAVAGVVVDQQKRLQMLGALQGEAAAPPARTERERQEREIARTAVELFRARPDQPDRVAALMALIRELCSPGPRP